MSRLATFVEARLSESDLPSQVKETYVGIAGIARSIRSAGKTDDWLSWLTGADPAMKIGEYVLGADAETQAAEFADQLLATLAATWKDHPDYQSEWRNKLPRR